MTHSHHAASDLLWEHWRTGERLPMLPEAIRPSTRAEGYQIQAAIERRSAFPRFGWKIAATSQAGQRHLAVDGPLAGRLLRERVLTDGAVVPFAHNQMRLAEAEFAFRMATDLPPRERPWSVAEVVAAVDTLHPAIEIPDSRFDDCARVGAPQLIADDACADYFVLGPAAPDVWRDEDLTARVVHGTVNGAWVRDGLGANVLGDPRIALTWLVNELSGLGVTLGAGEVVTTGTCLAPIAIAIGDRVRMEFGALGSVEATMGA